MTAQDDTETCELCCGSGMVAYGRWGSRPPRKTCTECGGTGKAPGLQLPARFPRRVQTSVIRPHSTHGYYVVSMFRGQALYAIHAAKVSLATARGSSAAIGASMALGMIEGVSVKTTTSSAWLNASLAEQQEAYRNALGRAGFEVQR